MNAYFISLFKYDLAANLKMLAAIGSFSPENGQAVALMSHLLASQQIWLKRCRAEKAIGGALWPDWELAVLEDMAKQNHADWMAYLNGLSAKDFEGLVVYRNSKGQTYENKLQDVLAHLINHGTHHRAQAGQQLKQAGLSPLPVTDYIFYVREQEQ